MLSRWQLSNYLVCLAAIHLILISNSFRLWILSCTIYVRMKCTQRNRRKKYFFQKCSPCWISCSYSLELFSNITNNCSPFTCTSQLCQCCFIVFVTLQSTQTVWTCISISNSINFLSSFSLHSHTSNFMLRILGFSLSMQNNKKKTHN